MGFYATNERQELIDHPPKNRVVGSAAFSFSRTGSTWSETQCSRPENDPTATTTASGMCFYGYRFYHPEIGRWINRDPIEEEGGINLYVVVNNAPLNYYDPLGEAPIGPGCSKSECQEMCNTALAICNLGCAGICAIACAGTTFGYPLCVFTCTSACALSCTLAWSACNLACNLCPCP